MSYLCQKKNDFFDENWAIFVSEHSKFLDSLIFIFMFTFLFHSAGEKDGTLYRFLLFMETSYLIQNILTQ